jgi:hypothetical protein
MTSSVIPARLEFQCGHAALVSLPRIKGESSAQRNERVAREKVAAQARACDFCGPDVAIVVQAAAPEPVLDEAVADVAADALTDLEAVAEVAALVAVAEEQTVATVEEEPVASVAEEPVAVVVEEPVVVVVEAPLAVVAEEPVAVVVEEPVVVAMEAPVAVVAEEPVAVVESPTAATRAARRTRTARSVAGELRTYTVQYRVERLIAASDVGDALRRVTELGATDVLEISRA